MSPRATPTQERAINSRRVIFDSALSLFREKGYENTTMRDIAKRAGVAVGAAYYYFKRKEDLVHEYYLLLEAGSTQEMARLAKASTQFKKRMLGIVQFKLAQVAPDRSLAKVLARIASDPDNELSPFSQHTRDIRENAINLMELLIEESDLKCGKELRPHASRLLWLVFMGMIFFWIQDRSPSQRQTEKLLAIAVPLLERMFWLSSLPLTGPINRLTIKLITIIFDAFTEDTQQTELPITKTTRRQGE